VLLVTRLNSTSAEQLSSAVEDLRVIDAEIVGIVLNRSRRGGASTYHRHTGDKIEGRDIRALQFASDTPGRTELD
jgi:Mrp family chromosome partitioning ATPase